MVVVCVVYCDCDLTAPLNLLVKVCLCLCMCVYLCCGVCLHKQKHLCPDTKKSSYRMYTNISSLYLSLGFPLSLNMRANTPWALHEAKTTKQCCIFSNICQCWWEYCSKTNVKFNFLLASELIKKAWNITVSFSCWSDKSLEELLCVNEV